ncbi:polysaccharide export protein [Sphingomonas sinipercae]|uniref:Polysaccharide export protein n=2 Tax=Sphingomonas sinipercae TaxID=2714944 RepID=A0A6G7ZQN6_9SPHN|nr:polysaccharide export protein [Sphingomonas sinipercae]
MISSTPSTRLPRNAVKLLSAAAMALALSGCMSAGASGPSAGRVMRASAQSIEQSGIKVVDVDGYVARRVALANRPSLFSDQLGPGFAGATVIGPGDVIDISIVEAPPAVLFSGALARTTISDNVRPTTVSSGIELPQQMVDLNGLISVPFAGSIRAAGRTPQQIAADIVSRLRGKAHDPQAVVRRVTNTSSTVSVLGEVNQSGRIPLTAGGERLLEVLATAGGSRQAVSKSVVQVTRGAQTVTLPMAMVVSDASQNIVLAPGDIVTVYYQPYTFTALGASGTNAEVPLEGTDVSLSQALGRIGGLQDNRADVKGVFIFRFEDPRALDPALLVNAKATPEGKIPVIYRVDMTNPATFLVAQNFPIKNKDVVYIANSPLTDFAKFTNIVASFTYTLVNLGTTITR